MYLSLDYSSSLNFRTRLAPEQLFGAYGIDIKYSVCWRRSDHNHFATIIIFFKSVTNELLFCILLVNININ